MTILQPVVQFPSNLSISCAQIQPTERPIEDRLSVHFDSTLSRLILGVYDGHGGAETAEHISKVLPPRLLGHHVSKHPQQFEQLDAEMLSMFKKDHSLFHPKSSNWAYNAQLVKSGSTALILDVDLVTFKAFYANAGDCRLVICSPDPDSSRNALLFQTQDLNVKSPSERERLQREHPHESPIVGNRLFGRLMSSRGFGDGYYKLPKRLLGNGPPKKYIDTFSAIERPGKIPMNQQYASLFYGYQTPPYLTATPSIGSVQLHTGDIVMLATDGLWDLVSSEEAAAIILRNLSADFSSIAERFLAEISLIKPPGDDVTVLIFRAEPTTAIMRV